MVMGFKKVDDLAAIYNGAPPNNVKGPGLNNIAHPSHRLVQTSLGADNTSYPANRCLFSGLLECARY
jgi:hypothetical protein